MARGGRTGFETQGQRPHEVVREAEPIHDGRVPRDALAEQAGSVDREVELLIRARVMEDADEDRRDEMSVGASDEDASDDDAEDWIGYFGGSAGSRIRACAVRPGSRGRKVGMVVSAEKEAEDVRGGWRDLERRRGIGGGVGVGDGRK
ncbi:hypothetical protein HK101_005605, partial [Irineochytrium annulatum]